jgi:hypothetical protein
VPAQPPTHVVTQTGSKLVHFPRFRTRDNTSDFIAADIALLPKAIKSINPGGQPAYSEWW